MLDLFLVLETCLKPELQYLTSLQIVFVKVLDTLVCLVSFKAFIVLGLIPS